MRFRFHLFIRKRHEGWIRCVAPRRAGLEGSKASGNGYLSTVTNPVHTYPGAGAYEVIETVQDGKGISAVREQTVAVGSQLLGNPDFESGTATPWTITPGLLVHNANLAHGGKWYASIGSGGTGVRTDDVSQLVTIPAGSKSATLSFYLKITSADHTVFDDDFLFVRIYDASNHQVGQPLAFSNTDAAGFYFLHNVDMSPYIGQTIRIDFEGDNDATLPTIFALDDVTLNVQ